MGSSPQSFLRAPRRAALVLVMLAFGLLVTGPADQHADAQQPAPDAVPDPVLPDRPDASPSADRMAADPTGEAGKPSAGMFESLAAGIRFRAPAGAKETRPTNAASDEIVQYVNDAKSWVIRVARLRFNDPVALTYHKRGTDPTSPDVNGLLEETVDNLKRERAAVEVFRQEIVRTGRLDIGYIAARFKIGTEDNVTQIALVRETPVEPGADGARVYYTFSLTAVAPKDPDALQSDPNVRAGVEALNTMVDSIELLDQRTIREDQNQRLYRTRTLFVNLTEPKLKDALLREQWLRLMRDGKDIGYSYIVEQTGRDLPRSGHRDATQTGGSDGVLIGVRTRTAPEGGGRVDGESWMWTSFDRKHEKWSNIRIVDDPSVKGGKDIVGEYGSSDAVMKLVKDDRLEEGERIGPGKFDLRQPPVRQREVLTLSVTHVGRNREEAPVVRELPPFYLPQALAHLLPRLIAGGGNKGYMFAMYNADDRQVMMRYVDVGDEGPAELGGTMVRAVPVNDRWGLEGSVTTHYCTRDGKYLGSINRKSGITVLPTDAATLEGIWKDANLTAPGAVDERK